MGPRCVFWIGTRASASWKTASLSLLSVLSITPQRDTLAYWQDHISTYFVEGGVLCLDLQSDKKERKYFGKRSSPALCRVASCFGRCSSAGLVPLQFWWFLNASFS